MRLYNILLYLYPASFRSEYGTEMCHVFAERRRMVSGAVALSCARICITALGDSLDRLDLP